MLCQITNFEIINGQVHTRIDDGHRFRTGHPSIDADSLEGYSVVSCSFTEELLKPNEFEFTLRRDNLEKNDKTKTYAVIKDLIGKTVTCSLSIDQSVFEIIGTIAKVSMKGLSVTCVANGADAQLQGHPKCRCFYGKTLSQIVTEVLNANQDIRSKNIDIHPDFVGLNLPYVVQYNENDYDFLARLAKRFGAFFYYHPDQKTLVFGKIPDQNVFDLTATHNVSSVSYELEAADPNFRHVAYHDAMGAVIGSEEPNLAAFATKSLMKCVVDGSEDRAANSGPFIDDPNRLPNDPTEDLLKKYSKSVASSMLGSQTTCRFVCYHNKVHVGDIVKVDGNGPVLVTSAHLTWESDGSFQSENTAMLLLGDAQTPIAYDTIFAPYMDINAYPKSSAQRAIVVDNLDPLKMGRVMVRFAWQDVGQANYAVPADDTNEHFKARKQYPWVRIAQPYAGNNKGCFILPEIGEEVMVGFENDNMERPFVIGSLFHDSATAAEKQMPDAAWVETRGKSVPQGQNPANKGNEVKAFRTKKGHTIEFHDVDGDSNFGFVRIYGKEDKKPNYDIILSTDPYQLPDPQPNNQNNKKNFATKSAKDEGIAAGEDIEEKDNYETANLRLMVRSYGGDIVLDAGTGDIIMNAANIRVHATGDVTTLIDKKNIIKVKEGQFADLAANSQVVQGKQTIVVKGEDTEEYKSKVTLKADKDVELKSLSEGSNFNLKIDAKSLSSDTKEKTEIKATQSALIKASTGLDLQGGSKADLKATNVTIDGEASTTVSGADLTLDGKKSISERAAKVELTSPSSISVRSAKIDLTSPEGSLAGLWKLP